MCLAIPGKVVDTYDQRGLRMAKVEFGGIVREACLEYVPETQIGEYVLVHVGFAISRIDEAEAERTYQALKELDQLTELESPAVEEMAETGGAGFASLGERRRASRMKYLDEYRNGDVAGKIVAEMRRVQTRPWVLMEVCGGQTHSIVKNGLDRLLPQGVELVHGPGCPVCVTPLEMIDKAHAIARSPDVIFCSFGDMLRVPGSDGDLFSIKSMGGDIRIVYSPLDCLKIARANPESQVVFFAIGFETTAPANAMLAWRAREEKVTNLSLLVSHVLVPPALEAILSAPNNRVQGFLGPGHVCAVMGYNEYEPISSRYHVPIVITGFEPIDILEGTLMTIKQLEQGRATVENQYSRILDRRGNLPAQQLIAKVFEVGDRKWRGIGSIPMSGYHLRDEFLRYDAEKIFDVAEIATQEPKICISGEILRGLRKPHDCPAFGTLCNPQHPLGATMVSAEGACAAYYAYGRHLNPQGGDNLHQIAADPSEREAAVQSPEERVYSHANR